MFVDDRKTSKEETTSVRIYEQDRERLKDAIQNPNMTMADKIRAALRTWEEDDNPHPYTHHLHRLQDKMHREGYLHEADHLEWLAAIWNRMENLPAHREALGEALYDALKNVLTTDFTEDEEGEPTQSVTIETNPDDE